MTSYTAAEDITTNLSEKDLANIAEAIARRPLIHYSPKGLKLQPLITETRCPMLFQNNLSFTCEVKGLSQWHVNGSNKFFHAVKVANIAWDLDLERVTAGNLDYVRVRLFCNKKSMSTNWSCKAKLSFALIERDGNTTNRVHNLDQPMRFNYLNRCYSENIIEWEDLWKGGQKLRHHDALTVECTIVLDEVVGIPRKPISTFTPSAITDAALIVEDKKIYVSRSYLAMESPYFATLFFGEFAEKDNREVELKDVKHDEFIDFLKVFHPEKKRVTKVNVEYLLKLADQFDVPAVLSKCIDFLRETKEIPLAKILLLSDTYTLSTVQDRRLGEIVDQAGMMRLSEDPLFNEYSDTMQATLHRRLLSVLHK